MRAGWLRHRVTIQTKSESRDSYGEPDYTWSDLATVYAGVEPLRGEERMMARAETQELTHRIRIRYYSDSVTPEARVKWGSRIFDIVEVINVLERDREQIMMCKEAV